MNATVEELSQRKFLVTVNGDGETKSYEIEADTDREAAFQGMSLFSEEFHKGELH